MRNHLQQYINGEWVDSTGSNVVDVINPATEEVIGQVCEGTEEDVNRAVAAALIAFETFSQTTKEERIELLNKIADEYEKRKDEFIETITAELGAPKKLSEKMHYQMGLAHFRQAAKELADYEFEERHGNSVVRKEAIGVSGLITPWNFPTNQTATKLASAFAAGCPVVLKPSELTPFSAILLAEVSEAAGLPKGVFNLVNGIGETVGNRISSHPDIEFVSFTGSGATGEKISHNAAKTVKKVALELGGKSPLIVLDDFDMATAAKIAVSNVTFNCGQVCTLASRVLVSENKHDEFIELVKAEMEKQQVINPTTEDGFLGPLISAAQFDRVQSYINIGMKEGAKLVVGGPGKPDGFDKGYFVKPTVFTDVKNNMVIAQEEIFGPVMSVITYKTVDEAIEIANDTIYGLASYVLGNDKETVAKVARSLRAGRVTINGAAGDYSLPFGGYKQSGIGREWGVYGIEEYLEVKAMVGFY